MSLIGLLATLLIGAGAYAALRAIRGTWSTIAAYRAATVLVAAPITAWAGWYRFFPADHLDGQSRFEFDILQLLVLFIVVLPIFVVSIAWLVGGIFKSRLQI